MPIPTMNTPELDMRQMILDLSTSEGWGLADSQVIVGSYQDDFYGNPFQIVLRVAQSDINSKWQLDNFTFLFLILGRDSSKKADVANASWAIHDAFLGRDTVYLDSGNRAYVHWNSNLAPADQGNTPENRPLFAFRLSVYRQILVDEGNRQAL